MFRLLGFDVRVRPGFVIFMLLIVVLYGDGFGLWLAGALAGFTLVHELGHAVVARRAGAAASISLDFLAGYTSYTPTRPMSRRQRAAISFAGPGTHIAAGVLTLVAMGHDPLDGSSVRATDAALAVWWAGPVIGLINLVPVLPLDGGHLVQTGLEAVIGRRAQRTMVIVSLVATVTFAVWTALDPDRRGFVVFIAFLLLAQLQLLGATGSPERRARTGDRQLDAAADAERSAWRTGRPGILVPGQELSPWYRAHRALLAGRSDEARRLLVDDLTTPGPRRWWPPDVAPAPVLRQLVDLLPRPLPAGNPASEQVLSEILLQVGDPGEAGRYAADRFAERRSGSAALSVARAAAAMGDQQTAVAWLLAAADATPPGAGDQLARAITSAPELATVRQHPDVQRLL